MSLFSLTDLGKLAKQTSIYGLSSIAGRFLNVLLVPLYTANFTPSEYGKVSYLYVLIAFVTVVTTQGMETSFFYFSRKREEIKEHLNTALVSVLFLAIPFSLICWFFPGFLSKFISLKNTEKLIQYGGLIIFFDAVSAIAFAYLRFEQNAKRFARVRLSGIGLNIILNILLLVLIPYLNIKGWNIPFLPIEPKIEMIFVSNLFSSALVFALLKDVWWSNKLFWTKERWKRMCTYGWPILLIGLAGMINETLDRVLLSQRLTTENPLYDIGVYSAFYKIAIILSLFNQAFRYAVEPFFFENAEKGSKTSHRDLMNVYVLFGSFFVVAVSLFSPYLAKLLVYGDSYYQHEYAFDIIPVLLFANLFLGMYFIVSIWYKLTNQNKYGLYISLLGAGLTVLFNYIFIPVIGILASALTTFLVYLTMTILAWKLGSRHYTISYAVKKIIFNISFSIVVVVLFYQLVDLKGDALWLYAFFVLALYGLIIYYLEGKNILIVLSEKRGGRG